MSVNAFWAPQPGSQQFFIQCPFWEAIYEGTRGPGKSMGLIMDFAQHIGQGFGSHWRGILFRETYPQLSDIVSKTKQFFYHVFPKAKFNESNFTWKFPAGEELLLRHMRVEDDYWNYHGHEYPWIGWEELCNWSSPACYESMKACSRSSHPGMPRKYRATCNPYGVGHNWVKAYFIDPAPAGVPIIDTVKPTRVRIHGSVYENKILMVADPGYIQKLESITDKNKRKAWLQGSWDIVAGGMFDDVWDYDLHVLRPMQIPQNWRIYRSLDWGSSKPFSVGWWTVCNGETLSDGKYEYHFPKETIIRIEELYGWDGNPDTGCKQNVRQVAERIKGKEATSPILRGHRVERGPADSAIYSKTRGGDEKSIGDEFNDCGVPWIPCTKGPGSRKSGNEILRGLLSSSLQEPMEYPGLLIYNNCQHFIRTVPVLPRDKADQDQVDSAAEDHIYDESRYFCAFKKPSFVQEDLNI